MASRIELIARPAIFAHRGASAHAPENTLAAFRLAVEHGADGIELDATLTADGQVVVIHDDSVDRTTEGVTAGGDLGAAVRSAKGAVHELTLAQIKALDAGSFFDSAFAGERIPTLAEVFEAVGAQTLINVEIKKDPSGRGALPEKIAGLVTHHGLQDSIIFSSFYPQNLFRIRRQLPETPVALLTLPGPAWGLLRGWLGRLISPRFLHPYYQDVSEASLAADHRRGRRVNVWTVDDPQAMACLFKMGIDGIITNDPRLARRVLEEK